MRPVNRIKLNGAVWLQFDGLSIQSTVTQLAARCNFRMVNSLKLEGNTKFPIHKEDEVEIFIFTDEDATGVTVFKGLVTGIGFGLDGSLDVNCATSMIHLETCDHYLDNKKAQKHYIKTLVTDIIKDVIKVYNVPLVFEYKKHDLKIVKGYNVSYDENVAQPTPRAYASNVIMTLFTIGATDTVETIIRKLCNKVGLIPLDNRKGGLMLVDKHYLQTDTVLRQGDNIKQFAYSSSMEHTYSLYHVLSKNAVEVGKKVKKEDSFITVDVKNANVKNYRAKTIQVDALDVDECSMVGAARHKADMINAIQFQVGTPGWWTKETVIWAPNMIVPVDIPIGELNGNYTVSGVNLIYSVTGGYFTTIDLKPDTVLEYDDPSTYDKTPIEDEDPTADLSTKKTTTKKRGKKVPLKDADLEAMTIDEILESGGFQ